MSRVEVLHSSVTQEWFTPKIYIEAVHEVLGSIDLDPASCLQAQRTVRALKFYTLVKLERKVIRRFGHSG